MFLLSNINFLLIYYVLGYHKKVVFENYKNSFPKKNEQEIKKSTGSHDELYDWRLKSYLNKRKIWHPFFNRDTAFLKVPDTIAKKTNQIVLFPTFKKLKRGHYQLTFYLLADDPIVINGSGIVKKYAEQLEVAIKKPP